MIIQKVKILKDSWRELVSTESALIGFLVLVKILFHILLPEYGYHRDELYYMAIGDGFSFQNLEILPLSPLYIKFITSIFGNSIKSVHFASAFLGAMSLLFSCLIAKELGGKKYAIFLTGITVLFSGFIFFGSLFTYDSLDFLLWVSAIYFMVKIFKNDNPRLWLQVGIIMGIGLLNKLTILFLGLSIFVCLWMVPQRVYFKNKWIWIAAGVALVFSLPFVIWQFTHDWYFLDFAANYAGGISYSASFPEFLLNQLLPNNPFNFPVWIVGLGLLLFTFKWKQYRFFGYIYLFLFFFFYIIEAKFYFLIPLYTILLAVGSIKIEEYLRHFDKGKEIFLKVAFPVVFVLLTMPLLPMAVPILPVGRLIEFVAAVDVDAGIKYENNELNLLPQHFADRFGWEEMVQEIAKVFEKIPDDDKEGVGIITDNWGQASAVHRFRKKYKLPEPTSTDGWFYFETMRTNTFKDTYISIDISEHRLKNLFEEVQKVGIFSHPYVMPHENNKPIYINRKPKFDLRMYWTVQRQINPEFIGIVESKGVTEAIQYFRDAKEKDSSIIMFSEAQINALGYKYILQGEMADAIELFKLNVEIFQEASNVYDSLGEAYMANGEYGNSIRSYKMSLSLNPSNANAVEKLSQLEEMTK